MLEVSNDRSLQLFYSMLLNETFVTIREISYHLSNSYHIY